MSLGTASLYLLDSFGEGRRIVKEHPCIRHFSLLAGVGELGQGDTVSLT